MELLRGSHQAHKICGLIILSSNSVCKICHQKLVLKYNLVTNYHLFYRYTLQRIFENDHVHLLWDPTVATDRSVDHNKPVPLNWDTV